MVFALKFHKRFIACSDLYQFLRIFGYPYFWKSSLGTLRHPKKVNSKRCKKERKKFWGATKKKLCEKYTIIFAPLGTLRHPQKANSKRRKKERHKLWGATTTKKIRRCCCCSCCCFCCCCCCCLDFIAFYR